MLPITFSNEYFLSPNTAVFTVGVQKTFTVYLKSPATNIGFLPSTSAVLLQASPPSTLYRLFVDTSNGGPKIVVTDSTPNGSNIVPTDEDDPEENLSWSSFTWTPTLNDVDTPFSLEFIADLPQGQKTYQKITFVVIDPKSPSPLGKIATIPQSTLNKVSKPDGFQALLSSGNVPKLRPNYSNDPTGLTTFLRIWGASNVLPQGVGSGS